MPKPIRRRRVVKTNHENLIETARKTTQHIYGRLVTTENPVITALLADLDRGDGKRTEYDRVSETCGVKTGLAVLVPRSHPLHSPTL